MPKKTATQLLGEDAETVGGDVYMSPQTLLRDDEDHKPISRSDEDEGDTQKKLPSFKARLLLSDDVTRSIGEFKGRVDRVACRIHMDYIQDWTSSLRFEIKAFKHKPSPVPGREREEELVHVWVFRLNATSDISAKPLVHMFPAGFTGRATGIEEQMDKLFFKSDPDANDPETLRLRQAGNLGYLELVFTPSKVHTEGILQEIDDLGNFQSVQDQLLEIFGTPSDKPMKIKAFFAVSDAMAFYGSYGDITEAWGKEKQYPPWTRWFNGISTAKCRIQKGQITAPDQRPENLVLPYTKSYGSSELCWATEGLSILLEEENAIEDVKTAHTLDCELRVLQTAAGGDRVYIGLLRLPDTYPYRFSAEDSFQVEIGSEEWSATILPRPFPHASSIDYSIQLNRPFDIETGDWSTEKLGSVFGLSTAEDIHPAEIERYCFNGEPNVVHVKPVLSDIPTKFKLAAIKKLNPAHVGENNHVPNTRWQRLILGQDLRTIGTADLFEGIDIQARLRDWGIQLTESQLAALEYVGKAPNHLGLVLGPWGTGKTKLDVVVTLLLMSVNKKVKILSPTNKAADSFVEKLNAEIARIKEAGFELTEKHVVRFHSPTTEAAVVLMDSIKYIDPPTARLPRWLPDPGLATSVYDKIAADIIEDAMTRVAGIPDRRYKLHEASFGTLLLRTTGVLDRLKPNIDTNSPDGLLAPVDSLSGNLPEANKNQDHDNGDEDTRSGIQSDEHIADDGHDLGSERVELRDLTVEEKLVQLVRNRTQEMFKKAAGNTELEKYCASFRQMFFQAENGELDGEESRAVFKAIEKKVSELILKHHVVVMVTTLVNSGHSLLKDNFQSKHTIVQEAGKADNGDLFIALAECVGDHDSIHLSGDPVQLPPHEHDTERNPFAKQTNRSLFQRWIFSGYPKQELRQQHRTIPMINDVISKIWYEGTVVSTVKPEERPNVAKASEAHSQLFDCSTPLMWVNTDGRSIKLGHSHSSQNTRELQVAVKLCEEYVNHGIEAKHIVILTGYMAQANLTKRVLALTDGLHDVDSGTIDGYQGEEKSIAILCVVGSQKLGFMASSARLLTGVSRAADGLVIITNSTGLDVGEHKRRKHQYDYLKYLIGPNACVNFSDPLPDLNILMRDDGDAPVPNVGDEAAGSDWGKSPGSGWEDANGDADKSLKRSDGQDAGGSDPWGEAPGNGWEDDAPAEEAATSEDPTANIASKPAAIPDDQVATPDDQVTEADTNETMVDTNESNTEETGGAATSEASVILK